MEKTPNALRKHIIILGNTNSGKSTIFNALTGQNRSIVSPEAGTTTDPVKAPMELIPFGPIVLIDTGGLNDTTTLGQERIKRTEIAKRSADAAIYAADIKDFDESAYNDFKLDKIPHILVFTKNDLGENEEIKNKFPEALFIFKDSDLSDLKSELSKLLSKQPSEDLPMIGDLIPKGSNVILVTPIDSAAPKGRLILPQIQCLRECLDSGICATVCKETEFEQALSSLNKVDLVVTDSQVFGFVNGKMPGEIPLTSFSMLLARQKGDFALLLDGARKISALKDGDKILMLEGCTHNSTHEDIGRVKIPAMLKKSTGKDLRFEYHTGYDFPKDLSEFTLAIQCGSCMINRREILSRLEKMKASGLPVSNYGMVIAWSTGILERCCEIFGKAENQ